jgi:hypothetical protein
MAKVREANRRQVRLTSPFAPNCASLVRPAPNIQLPKVAPFRPDEGELQTAQIATLIENL